MAGVAGGVAVVDGVKVLERVATVTQRPATATAKLPTSMELKVPRRTSRVNRSPRGSMRRVRNRVLRPRPC